VSERGFSGRHFLKQRFHDTVTWMAKPTEGPPVPGGSPAPPWCSAPHAGLWRCAVDIRQRFALPPSLAHLEGPAFPLAAVLISITRSAERVELTKTADRCLLSCWGGWEQRDLGGRWGTCLFWQLWVFLAAHGCCTVPQALELCRARWSQTKASLCLGAPATPFLLQALQGPPGCKASFTHLLPSCYG